MTLAAPLAVAGCVLPPPAPKSPPPPLPLPAMGSTTPLKVDGADYQVIRSPLPSAKNGTVLRVYRAKVPALTFSQGVLAKKVVEAYCAKYNRTLDPASLGMFEAVGDWAFPGGCA